ncbi:DUF192 domain-containing protein [Tepidamorphus sp. 3E244]|uniref:DUF192 domain-containing protein n=1 Tax=Tepidamorphus sp. 3E244 TaxID=3385498 RepID=UPI0038FCD4B5
MGTRGQGSRTVSAARFQSGAVLAAIGGYRTLMTNALHLHACRMLALVAGLFLVLAAAAPLSVHAKDADKSVVIMTQDGAQAFSVELALTSQQQARGLMFRNSLPERHGMLFDFGPEREVSMWMKNTLISLDMVFINADGTVHRVARGTEPLSLDIVGSQGRVRAVLELAAGSAEKYGIRKGDTVRHSIFGNTQ